MLQYERLVKARPADDTNPGVYVDKVEIEETVSHVRAHLSAIADSDDNPFARDKDVRVEIGIRKDSGGWPHAVVSGTLDAEADDPLKRPDYDPWEGVPEELRAEARDDG